MPVPENLRATNQEPSELQRSRTRGKAGERPMDWSDQRWREMASVYYNLTETADALVGKVLAAVAQAGLKDNTVIVFTSDHGECLGAHQFVHKQKFYEESAAVPMIVCAPGQGARTGVDAKHLVSGLDVLPTLCDYAGITPPASFQGLSLRPLIEQREVPWRNYVVAEVGEQHNGRMVRSDRYKYIVYSKSELPEQLFDLESDPGEARNLANTASSKAVLDSHRAMLKEWVQRTKDPFVMIQ
jgi:arylsulfatase A-like enzyme